MKTILCLIDNLGSGGAQRQMVNLAVLLKAQGYDVDFAVYTDSGFYEPLLINKDIKVRKILKSNRVTKMFAVRSYIRKQKPDAVIAFLAVPCFLACLSKAGGGKFKVITTERSAKLSTFNALPNRVFNWFERYSNVKVCNSENARKLWDSNYPQYHGKYKVIYNPVLMTENYDKNFGFLRDGQLHLVVAASYQELKGSLRVIEAVKGMDKALRSRLVIDWYGASEVVKGNTKIFDESVKRIEDYGLSSQIHLHGETPDIYKIMNQADMVGLFSTVEGLPNAICEAMMLGKPVMMSRVSDYIALTEGNGISFEPTVEGIREGLEAALSYSSGQLKGMGEKSYVKAKQLFSPEMIVKQWIEVIEG
ncbi:MAG: glycosyltransferase [Clostridia bacterium]